MGPEQVQALLGDQDGAPQHKRQRVGLASPHAKSSNCHISVLNGRRSPARNILGYQSHPGGTAILPDPTPIQDLVAPQAPAGTCRVIWRIPKEVAAGALSLTMKFSLVPQSRTWRASLLSRRPGSPLVRNPVSCRGSPCSCRPTIGPPHFARCARRDRPSGLRGPRGTDGPRCPGSQGTVWLRLAAGARATSPSPCGQPPGSHGPRDEHSSACETGSGGIPAGEGNALGGHHAHLLQGHPGDFHHQRQHPEVPQGMPPAAAPVNIPVEGGYYAPVPLGSGGMAMAADWAGGAVPMGPPMGAAPLQGTQLQGTSLQRLVEPGSLRAVEASRPLNHPADGLGSVVLERTATPVPPDLPDPNSLAKAVPQQAVAAINSLVTPVPMQQVGALAQQTPFAAGTGQLQRRVSQQRNPMAAVAMASAGSLSSLGSSQPPAGMAPLAPQGSSNSAGNALAMRRSGSAANLNLMHAASSQQAGGSDGSFQSAVQQQGMGTVFGTNLPFGSASAQSLAAMQAGMSGSAGGGLNPQPSLQVGGSSGVLASLTPGPYGTLQGIPIRPPHVMGMLAGSSGPQGSMPPPRSASQPNLTALANQHLLQNLPGTEQVQQGPFRNHGGTSGPGPGGGPLPDVFDLP
eukprot:jgi/Botrbrau1/22314/Bobra.0138s0064.1